MKQSAPQDAAPVPPPATDAADVAVWRPSIPPHVRAIAVVLLPVYSLPALSGPEYDGFRAFLRADGGMGHWLL